MENWRDDLPEELKTSTNLAKYESLEDALTGFDQAAGRLGRSITVPSEDSGDDARVEFIKKLRAAAPMLTFHPDHADDHGEEFWNLLGVPEDAKGYTPAEGFEGLPKEVIEETQLMAKAAGWTKKQFQATLVELAKQHEGLQTSMTEAQAADAAIIDSEWGNAKDDRKASVAALIKQFEDPANKVGDLNAATYLMLDKIVAAFTGDGPQAFKQPQGTGAMTPEEINDELEQIDKRLIKEGNAIPRPTHKRLMEKKKKLLKMRTP